MTEIHFLRNLSAAIVLIVTATGSNLASAQDVPPLGVEWQCFQQYDESFNIECIPEPAVPGGVAPEAPGGIVEASLLRAGGMRPAARSHFTEAFFTTDQKVPLYSAPRDKVMVNYLLQTMLCDTAPRCSVKYRSY